MLVLSFYHYYHLPPPHHIIIMIIMIIILLVAQVKNHDSSLPLTLHIQSINKFS